MIQKTKIAENISCPCGSGDEYGVCCSRFIRGDAVPETAEQLMRSRYSGFVVSDESYLLATWHPDTRPSRVRLDEKQRWLGLSIRATEAGGPDDRMGVVEFVARFKIDGKGHRLHEISRFEKIDGRWHYLDGQHL
ncbi:MAG: YchJ family protein [Gammaproteobacteria bacterium]|jgi:SEC-C motif-containing protein|nr:YchJ family protein [Gammaproteobacteria bacterium]